MKNKMALPSADSSGRPDPNRDPVNPVTADRNFLTVPDQSGWPLLIWYRQLNPARKLLVWAASLIIGAIMPMAMLGRPAEDYFDRPVLMLALALPLTGLTFLLLYALQSLPRLESLDKIQRVWLVGLADGVQKDSSIPQEASRQRRRFWLTLASHALVCILVWLVYLMAFYPGGLSVDSYDVWGQGTTRIFTDWHPLLYTLLTMLARLFWNFPAAVILLQILFLAVAQGYVVAVLARIGLPRVGRILLTAVLLLNPANNNLIVFMWKDAPFAASFLLLTAIGFQMVISHGLWLKKWTHGLFLTLTVLMIFLFRHNGLAPAALFMLIMLVAFPRCRRQALIWSAVILVALGVFKGPVYTILNVSPHTEAFGEIIGLPMEMMADVLVSGGELSAETSTFLQTLMPLADWQELHVRGFYNSVKWSGHLDHALLESVDRKAFVRMWLDTMRRNPRLTFSTFCLSTRIGWEFIGGALGHANIPYLQDNIYGITKQPIWPWAEKPLTVFSDLTRNYLAVFFWKPAVWFWTLFILSVALVLKKRSSALIFTVPLLINHAAITATLCTYESRFYFFEMAAGWLIVLLALILLSFRPIEQAEQDRER